MSVFKVHFSCNTYANQTGNQLSNQPTNLFPAANWFSYESVVNAASHKDADDHDANGADVVMVSNVAEVDADYITAVMLYEYVVRMLFTKSLHSHY